jgi:hypothetical protein
MSEIKHKRKRAFIFGSGPEDPVSPRLDLEHVQDIIDNICLTIGARNNSDAAT